MRPGNWKQSRQSIINHASSSSSTSPGNNQSSRTSTNIDPSINVREHSFPDHYGMQNIQSYANDTINSVPDLVNQDARIIKSDHDQNAFRPMNDSTANLYPTTNSQHSFPTHFNHPTHDLYNDFSAGQGQVHALQPPDHQPNDLLHHSNVQASQASQLFFNNRPTVCVCGMMGQSQCICGFAEAMDRGVQRLDANPSEFNNASSHYAVFGQAVASQRQSMVPQKRQNEANDSSSNTSAASIVTGRRQSANSNAQLDHPSTVFPKEQHPPLFADSNDHPWQGRSFNDVNHHLYGSTIMNGLKNLASTSDSLRKIASSSTSNIDIADNQGQYTNDFRSEETRWNAIVRRSHLADSHFVYGAQSTRIYCRPSCASKQPERSKVIYFLFPDAAMKAEKAGYRACKRCKPGTQGVADACVLAVGECLRHMTRAAILGESEDVDGIMKKKTLKQYSSDFGVSAFHFHRTLKKVSTMTPGEYGQVCHALVLQDELGMDKTRKPLETDELQRKLRGWSARRARRALGNVLPMVYASGMLDMQIVYVVAENTPYGCVVAMYGLDSKERPETQTENARENGQVSVVGLLIGDDAVKRALLRCPRAIYDRNRSQWLHSMINDLHAKGTREVQMPAEVIPWLRRARAYVAVKKFIESFP